MGSGGRTPLGEGRVDSVIGCCTYRTGAEELLTSRSFPEGMLEVVVAENVCWLLKFWVESVAVWLGH